MKKNINFAQESPNTFWDLFFLFHIQVFGNMAQHKKCLNKENQTHFKYIIFCLQNVGANLYYFHKFSKFILIKF